jgi:hypothetical protein
MDQQIDFVYLFPHQLHAGDYSQDEMAAALSITKEELQSQVLSPSTVDQEGFALRLRCVGGPKARPLFSCSSR